MQNYINFKNYRRSNNAQVKSSQVKSSKVVLSVLFFLTFILISCSNSAGDGGSSSGGSSENLPKDYVSVKAINSVLDKTVADSPVFIQGRTIEIKPFYICDHEVTQHEYESIMGKNPSYFQGDDADKKVVEGENQKNRPVEQVSWYDAIVYCNKRSIKEGLTPCYKIKDSTKPDDWGEVPTKSDGTWDAVTCDFEADGYRLPTEVEWEYAARGGNLEGTQTIYPGSNNIEEVAWYSGRKTHEVKKLKPNALGLYDMGGNVWEWCWDWYGTGTINASTPLAGPASGSARVLRGGSCYNVKDNCTSVLWYFYYPKDRHHSLGFRVVRSVSQ